MLCEDPGITVEEDIAEELEAAVSPEENEPDA